MRTPHRNCEKFLWFCTKIECCMFFTYIHTQIHTAPRTSSWVVTSSIRAQNRETKFLSIRKPHTRATDNCKNFYVFPQIQISVKLPYFNKHIRVHAHRLLHEFLSFYICCRRTEQWQISMFSHKHRRRITKFYSHVFVPTQIHTQKRENF